MSDHNERPCQKCGSLTHHENDCNDELDRLRQENERLKGEVGELKAKLKDAYLPSSAHIQDIYELTSHKQALEVARLLLAETESGRFKDPEHPHKWTDRKEVVLIIINNVLNEGK